MIIDAASLDTASTYNLLKAAVVPRAIGWISTLSATGVPNLAPFSFFTVASRMPPIVSLTILPRSDGKTMKDTFVNIRDTGEFVTNFVTLEQAEAMHRSAVDHLPEVDEFEIAGLKKADCSVVRAPRVEGAPISMECKLERIIPVGDVGDHVVFGTVIRYHIRDELYLGRGHLDLPAMRSIGRLAVDYTLVDNVFVPPLEAELVEKLGTERISALKV
jgi:flavin reductase (DIM6/NTAB) family NADH-FMN oxidoreductase RutF